MSNNVKRTMFRIPCDSDPLSRTMETALFSHGYIIILDLNIQCWVHMSTSKWVHCVKLILLVLPGSLFQPVYKIQIATVTIPFQQLRLRTIQWPSTHWSYLTPFWPPIYNGDLWRKLFYSSIRLLHIEGDSFFFSI